MLYNMILLQAGRSVHLWDFLFGNPGRVSQQTFQNIKMEVYLAGGLIALLFLGIAVLISNSIAFEPGTRPRDPRKRRLVFFITGAVAILFLSVLSLFSDTNLRGRQAEEFQQAMLFSVLINALIYFGLGFALSKMFPSSKIGTWFPSK